MTRAKNGNNQTVARKLARQMWGKISAQKKLADGIWYFDCIDNNDAGNILSGIIVDNEIYPVAKKWEHPVVLKIGTTYGYGTEQHFSAFEGKDETIAKYLFFDAIANTRTYAKDTATSLNFADWCTQMETDIQVELLAYRPDLIEELNEMRNSMLANDEDKEVMLGTSNTDIASRINSAFEEVMLG